MTGEIMGMEALIRWNHPERGLSQPGQFVSLAEEIGIMESIDHWVIRTACLQNKVLFEANLPTITVMVNLGAHQFRKGKLTEFIRNILFETALKPELLELEITENNIMENMDETMNTLHDLNAMGVKLAIDDFGTGYSSLNYLKSFPIHTLKIDRSFITKLNKDSRDAAMVKAIICLAHNLQLEVIAEGVETNDQADFLKENKCNFTQGFLYSKPIPFSEFHNFLKSKREKTS